MCGIWDGFAAIQLHMVIHSHKQTQTQTHMRISTCAACISSCGKMLLEYVKSFFSHY